MTIDNQRGRDDEMHPVPASQAEAHSLIALEQSALCAARLAIARWSNSSAEAALAAPAPEQGRALWYAQAQHNFQEWLGRGGFAQYDIPCAEPAGPAAAMPQGATTPPAIIAPLAAFMLAGSAAPRIVRSCID